ncbi:MAG: hypothetical protein V7K54_07120 [Nostoc sp.]
MSVLGDWGDEGAGEEKLLIIAQYPILLYERLRLKRSYAAGFTAMLSTSAQYPMPNPQSPVASPHCPLSPKGPRSSPIPRDKYAKNTKK